MNNGTSSATKSSKPATSGASPNVDDLARQIETIREDLSALASLFGEVGKAEASRAKDKLKAQGKAAQDLSEEQLERLRHTALSYRSEAEDFVRRKPEAALGIAAGLGLLVGLFLSNRR